MKKYIKPILFIDNIIQNTSISSTFTDCVDCEQLVVDLNLGRGGIVCATSDQYGNRVSGVRFHDGKLLYTCSGDSQYCDT